MAKINKKDIPLSVLRALEPFIDKKGDNFEIISNSEKLLEVIDSDKNSNYFFNIDEFKEHKGKFYLYGSQSPNYRGGTSILTFNCTIEEIQKKFDNWVNILKSYDRIKSFYDDDQIIKQYEEEFESEYKLIDDDQDYRAYSLKQQKQLVEYLDEIQNQLNQNQEITKEEKEEINEKINETKKNITKLTKRKVFDRMKNIWALCQKSGLSITTNVIANLIATQIIKAISNI